MVSVLRYDNNVTATPESNVGPLQFNLKHFGDLPLVNNMLEYVYINDYLSTCKKKASC